MKHRLMSALTMVTLFVMSQGVARAGIIDGALAGNIAQTFLAENVPVTAAGKSAAAGRDEVRPLVDPRSGRTVAYVVSLVPRGFVVIAADTRLQPVIAYAPAADFPEGEVAGDGFAGFLVSDLALRLANVDELAIEERERINEAWETYRNPAARSASIETRQWPEAGTTATGGWVGTAWGQLDPYNMYCPLDIVMDEPQRSPLGCTATAIFQVLNYHRDIDGLRLGEDDRYESFFGPDVTEHVMIDTDSGVADFADFATLNGYLASIEEKYANDGELTGEEIAALGFAVGIVAETDFSYANGSGASDDTFWQNFTTGHAAGYHWDIKAPAAADFYAVLKTNMMLGLPATLVINKTYLCSVNHDIVCDGYATSGLYHLNFGWSDTTPDPIADAWYALPAGMGGGYDLIQLGYMNIYPDSFEIPALAADTQKLDLGAAFPAEYTGSGVTPVWNTGATGIVISAIETDAPFEISLDGESFDTRFEAVTVPAGGNIVLTARCLPGAIGFHQGTVLFHYAEGGPRSFAVDLGAICLPVGGTIVNAGQVSGVWTAAGSPYQVCGDIDVYSNAPLSIGPGVDVIFRGAFSLTINDAPFYAIGTEADSIRFMPADPEVGWYGINLYHGMNDILTEHTQIFEYCSFTGGRAIGAYPNNTGAAIACTNASPLIRHCLFADNYASGAGNVLYISGLYGTVSQNAPKVMNSLFYNNRSDAPMGGAIRISGVTGVQFENVTMAGNQGKYGGAFSLGEGSSLYLTNCILWDNEVVSYGSGGTFSLGEDIHFNAVSDTVHVSYSIVDTSAVDWYNDDKQPGVLVWGEGNSVGDPQFTDAASFDYTLKTGSPAIDTGCPETGFNDCADPLEPGMARHPARGSVTNDRGAYGGGGFSAHPRHVTVSSAVSGGGFSHTLGWECADTGVTVTEYRIYRSLSPVIATVLPDQGFATIDERIAAEYQYAFHIGTVTDGSLSFTDDYEAPAYLTYYYWVSAVTGETESEKILADVATGITEASLAAFDLDPAYPNPFNPTTTIRFTIPEESCIRLDVYDIQGRLVRTLEDGTLAAGTYHTVWDGTDTSGARCGSGVYVYRLAAPRFTAHGKMLMVK